MQRDVNQIEAASLQELTFLASVESPSSASSSSVSRLSSPSVRITEYGDHSNPNPVVHDNHADEDGLDGDERESVLSQSQLRLASGVQDLSEVTFLEMQVNTGEQMLGSLGASVPNLLQLKLNDSRILSIRDLGTSLHNLRVLWMARCSLQDVDGVTTFESLEELYLAFNDISDISQISLLEKLEILDLEGNSLASEEQVSYLALCPALRSLTLDGNPVCQHMAQDETDVAGYRSAVKRAIPQLLMLDDDPLVPGLQGRGQLQSRSTVFESSKAGVEEDWRMVRKGIVGKQSVLGSEVEEEEEKGRSTPAGVARPITSMSTNPHPVGERAATSLGHYHHSSPTVLADRVQLLLQQDNSSELTHGLGQVMCGNPVRALRERKKFGLGAQSTVSLSPSGEPSPPPPALGQDVLQELKEWRLQYSRMSGRVSTGTPPARDFHTDTVRHAFEEDGLVITEASSITDLLEAGEEEERKGKGRAGGVDGGKLPLQDSATAGGVAVTTPPVKPHPPPMHKRLLPTPPLVTPDIPPRPRTVADFRVRRLKRHSAEVSLLSQGTAEVVDRTHFDSPEIGAAELREGKWSSTDAPRSRRKTESTLITSRDQKPSKRRLLPNKPDKSAHTNHHEGSSRQQRHFSDVKQV